MTGNKNNIYFDNAATSWPKPEAVYRSAEIHMRSAFGNPGRSGHTRTLAADRLIYSVRERMANFFNIADPARIAFTLNATDALNMAIKGLLEKGDHVLYTAMEHNAVLRPLARLKTEGTIETTMIPCSEEGMPDLDFLENAYRPSTRLLIINHASNVVGTIAPARKMIESAHQKGVPVLVDSAQSAGCIKIDIQADNIDLLAFTGHKGLLGPTGTGGLYVRPGLGLKPLREGGTGSQSDLEFQPENMPERLEAGTLNSTGLAGLLAGINYIQERGLGNIHEYEKKIRAYLYERLFDIKGINIFGPPEADRCSCVISFNLGDTDCGSVGHILESRYGIFCRTGLHCAPYAHRSIGTFPAGTVRISPGIFTTTNDIDYLIKALKEIATLAGI
ncbi:MAG: aminotransferase class V-fold PLP-dependent enzyme [Bacillota bacterium]|nr:aminotransferase class V-fold PLP-dependent enzyme [Bacillota bacterium]